MATSSSALSPEILQQLKNPTVRQLLATMMVREAGGEGPEGMKDAFQVAVDRANESGQSLQEVLMTPDAFTSMTFTGLGGNRNVRPLSPGDLQRAYSIMDDPNLKWDLPTTADAFINPALQARFSKMDPKHYKEHPDWLEGKTPVGEFGRHQFYATGYKGGGKPLDASAANLGANQTGQTPNDLVQFELPPEQQDMVRQNQAAAHALLQQQLANIDAQGPIIEDEIAGLQSWQDSANAAQARYDKTMSSVIDSLPDEHKMQMDELRKVSPDHPGDPHRALTEFLPMLVMLGGMFARGGGIGAMKASAAAVNAARAHDDQALERAHQEFQDNLTEAVDKSSMAHEQLGEAIASAKGNQQLLIQKADLLGTELGLPALKIAALNGDTNAILTAFANQSRAIAQATAWSKAQSYIALNQAKIAQLNQQIGSGQDVDDQGLWILAKASVYDPNVKPPPFTRNQDEMRRKYIQYQTYAAAGAVPPGITDDPAGIADVAGARSTITAEQQALNQNTKNLAGLKSFVQSFDSITALAEKAVGPGTAGLWGPMWNAPIREALKQTGNPNVPLLNNFLYSLGLEYGKITGGSYGSVRPVSDAQEEKISNDILSGNMTVNQIYTVLQGMRQEASSRIDGLQTTNAELSQDIRSTASAPNQPTPTLTNAPAKPAAPPAPKAAGPGQGLTADDKKEWVGTIEDMQAQMRKGAHPTRKYITDQLLQHYPNASQAQLDAGADAVLNTGKEK